MQAYDSINCENPHLQTVKPAHAKALGTAVFLAVSMCVLKLAAGIVSGSLALVSDAFHSLTDTCSLIAAYYVNRLSFRKSSNVKTFGYQRAEVLMAFATGVLLIAVSFFIIHEAIERLSEPYEINTAIMLIFAVLGVFINAVILKTLHRGGKENINIKSAFFHVMADFLGLASVFITALIIKYTGFVHADLIASGFIVCVILFNAFRILKETINLLMEGVPDGIDFFEVAKSLAEIENVKAVHELHVWGISNRFVSATAHLTVEKESDSSKIIQAASDALKDKFGIMHTTFQIEKRAIDNVACSGSCCGGGSVK